MNSTERRDAAITELLSTEAEYVSDMKLLVDVFVLPLEKWATDLKASLDSDEREADPLVPDLSHEDCNKLFANAKQLANFNRQFLVDLQRAHGGAAKRSDMVSPVFRESGNWRRITAGRDDDVLESSTYSSLSDTASKLEDDPFKPAGTEDVDRGPKQMLEVFLKSAPFLKMYSQYVNNFDVATARLIELENDNPSFMAFLTACEKQKPCRGRHLRDFLLLPVQRIPKYRRLLETILENTSIESTMHSKVEESLTTMGGIASKINADTILQQRKDKVFELQQQFGATPFVTASRLFVKEGDLRKVARNGTEELHFVLFNDLLVYGQARRRRVLGGGSRSSQLYHFRREIDLNRCFVVDAPSYGSRCPSVLGETGILIVSELKSFMVMAKTPVEKDAWLQAIRACMRDLSSNSQARDSLRRSEDFDGDTPHSPWSMGSTTHSPLTASAPRSVWVPGKGGQKSVRLVDFALPMWAGVRISCGCLSHTELTWGKEGLSAAAAAAADAATSRGLAAASPENATANGTAHLGGSDGQCPRQESCVVTVRRSGQLGLRLRDVHPGCGGGVVVLGFEPKSAGKRAGVLQGDRITHVDGVAVVKIEDVIRAMTQPQSQLQTKWHHADQRRESSSRRSVHLALLRGFPKSDRPWLPPLEPSPISTVLSPPSSAVESRSDDEGAESRSPSEDGGVSGSGGGGVPQTPLSAPGPRTFGGRSGATGAGRHSRGFSRAFSSGGIDVGSGRSRNSNGVSGSGTGSSGGRPEARVKSNGVSAGGDRSRVLDNTRDHNVMSATVAAAAGAWAAMASVGRGVLMGPPSPEAKSEDDDDDGDGDSGGELSGSAGTGDSLESSGTLRKGPAPPQANVNAGGAPSKPFAAQAQNRKVARQASGSSTFSHAGSALTACLTCQTDSLFLWDDENSKPTEFRPDEHAQATPRSRAASRSEEIDNNSGSGGGGGRKSIEKLKGAMVGACVGGLSTGDGEMDRGERSGGRTAELEAEEKANAEEFRDTRSVASDSSGGSSVFLTAVSPSRIPPPLMNVPSVMPPPPPISMTSSMVSGSFSNLSPGSTNTGTPDTSISSMSWLKPLPPPPPRREMASSQATWESADWGSNSSAGGAHPSAPASFTRGGLSTAYPPGRWVQTPPLGTPTVGEPKISPRMEQVADSQGGGMFS